MEEWNGRAGREKACDERRYRASRTSPHNAAVVLILHRDKDHIVKHGPSWHSVCRRRLSWVNKELGGDNACEECEQTEGNCFETVLYGPIQLPLFSRP